jgi:hypothetical protein
VLKETKKAWKPMIPRLFDTSARGRQSQRIQWPSLRCTGLRTGETFFRSSDELVLLIVVTAVF